MKYPLLLVILIVFSKTAVAETNKTTTDYELGKQALASNDCESANQYFKKYISDNLEALQKHNEFLEKMEKQMEICGKQLEEQEESKTIIARDRDIDIRAAVKNIDKSNATILSAPTDEAAIIGISVRF